jgi:UDP-N-acetylglucosamine 2-epimerase (non-hydrolysing)
MKVAPLHRVFKDRADVESLIVHTGQHYDEKMSDVFFNQLGLPKPDYFLGIGSGSHAEATANIMIAFEKVVLKEKPDMVLVVGDVNSTLACALVASKLHIKLVHVEAGLRSGDRMMPEEINRVITDSIADLLFVTEDSGLRHLKREGVDDSKVFFSGNVMIDSVVTYLSQIKEVTYRDSLGLKEGEYILTTFHRPSNVDNESSLTKLIQILRDCANRKRVVFAMHPRTKNNLLKFGLMNQLEEIKDLIVLPPLGYLEFLSLVKYAALVVTDSGGIQEETTFLKVPCITLRSTTERPVTTEIGTNTLIKDLDAANVSAIVDKKLATSKEQFSIPPLWDGKAAERIASSLIGFLSTKN